MQKLSRILIVDDNPSNIFVLEEMLRDDYHIETAESGEAALEIAPDFLPDLILLDIMMPGIDGYETCRRMRENPSLAGMKIVMVSAKAMKAERLQGYEVGADDYVTKPFDEDELLAKVRVYVRLKVSEDVEKIKSSMYALLKHEHRTPLRGILLPVQELRTNAELDPQESAMFLEMIEQNTSRLQHLFEKVHTLGAMKAGQWNFEFFPSGLNELVRQTVEEKKTRILTCDLKMHTDLPDEASLDIDGKQIRWVVAELLDNAVQFSPLEAQVTIEIGRDNAEYTVSVCDQGDGIDMALLPHVFEAFGHPDGMHHTKGYGLSLAIARQIILAHQGSIEIKSTKGIGIRVTLRFPVKGVESLAKAAQESDCHSTALPHFS